MDGHAYVSCIKINGVPILPPVITKDMKKELSSYKESAINIEQTMIALRKAKQCNAGKASEVDNLKGNCDATKNENEIYMKSNRPAKDMKSVPIEVLDNFDGNVDEALHIRQNMNLEQKDLVPATVPRSAIATYNNDTESNTAEIALEIGRPQVPKTLNIVPLTLTNTNCRQGKEYQESDSDNTDSTPKLIRQGSYVLDTPSPMLLAHMQMELTSSHTPSSEYVPTLCSNTVHRKKWNIAEAKVEWEHEAKNKHSTSIESSKSLPMFRENFSSSDNHMMHKSISLQEKLESHLGAFHSRSSVGSIQTMLAEENVEEKSINTNYDKEPATTIDNEEVQECNRVSILNGTCKIGGPLGDVSMSNCLTAKLKKKIEAPNSTSKVKSTLAASNKLLTVYKKIQEMHKNQMAELMARQQREQALLQEEFEKQQLLLLTEIRKSFPEFSVALFSENVLSPSMKCMTPTHCDIEENVTTHNSHRGHNAEEKGITEIVHCPLDVKYSKNKSCSIKNESSGTDGKQENMEIQLNSSRDYEAELLENIDCKRSNVSRELFPLDSKTTHLPILGRTIYGTEHIKAVNVINAYVRGYLVRRIMRTERVIALKNTYKEALQCMLKLHIDSPINRSEYDFLDRLQLQCDAASVNIVELFAQSPQKRMQVIAQDREIKQSRIERPTSARSYSFATQRTLARKKLKEMEECQRTSFVRPCLARSRCQTWTSDIKEGFISSNVLEHGIKRSTSARTVRKPWR